MDCDKSSSLRSKRKRSTSKGDREEVALKKLHTGESAVEQNLTDPSLNIGEMSFTDNLKKVSELVADGSAQIMTSTPSSTTRKRRGKSMASLDTSVGQMEVAEVSGRSAVETDASTDSKALDFSGATDDGKPVERNSRRNKCTSARVLLGLVRRKSAGQGRDLKEKESEEVPAEIGGMKEEVAEETEKPKKSKEIKKGRFSNADSKTSVKVKQEKDVQRDVLVAALEGLPEASLSIERCSDVKPDWLKPFDQGWRREVVFRNTSKSASSSKPSCDIYYFSSDDTKLRSLPQIIEYLKTTKSDLTRECFTFTKNTIYKEPEELVRSAAFCRGRGGPRSSLQNSNESSMKSFDDGREDVSSQISSASTVQKPVSTKRKRKKMKFDAEISVKTEDLKSDLPSDSVAPEPTATPEKAKEPDVPAKTEIESKEGVSAEAGGGQTDEMDKRKAVRAAATLALRTYMNHALRTVNNPLLQNKGAKSSSKTKAVVAKSPSKSKSPRTKHKVQSTDQNLLPVVSLTKVGFIEDEVRNMSSAGSMVKKVVEPVRSTKPSPLTKMAKIKSKTRISKRVLLEDVKAMAKKTALHKKSYPLKSSTSQQTPATAQKESDVKRDCEVSLNKLPRSVQDSSASAKPSKSKAITPTVGKTQPKSDVKSVEKPVTIGERRLSVPSLPKPIECTPIAPSRICGMDCAGRLGIPPSLLCATCMRTYHPECAGYVSQMYLTPHMDFACWHCRKLNKELENTSYSLGKYEFSSLEAASEACPSESRSSEALSSTAAKQPPDIQTSSQNQKNVDVPSDEVGHTTTAALSKSQDPARDAQSETENVGDVSPTVPTAQLLVLPIGIKKFLNLSMALILVVNDREMQVEPYQLKASSIGVNIRLPMGTLPDVFVRGPESPLEFRVLSSAASGRQVVSVALYKWPCDLVSENFNTDVNKEDVNANPVTDLELVNNSGQLLENFSAVSLCAGDSKSSGGGEAASLIQSEGNAPVEVMTVSADVTESEIDKLLSSDGGDCQIVDECASSASHFSLDDNFKKELTSVAVVTSATDVDSVAVVKSAADVDSVAVVKSATNVDSVAVVKSATETDSVAVVKSATGADSVAATPPNDESSIEDQKNVLPAVGSESALEFSSESRSASLEVDAKEPPVAARSCAMDCGDSVFPTSQSSRNVNLCSEDADVAGFTETGSTTAIEDHSMEPRGAHEKAAKDLA